MTMHSSFTEIYMVKKSGIVWYKYLTNNLPTKLGFTKSDINKCVFYRG